MKGRKPSAPRVVGRATTAPPPPAWLPKPAQAEWARTVPLLVERGILTDGDLGCVENYCLAVGQVRACQDELSGLASMFVQSDNSAPRPHPAFRLMHTAMAEARRLAAELGLTPVSRGRPALAGQTEANGGWGDLVDG